MLHKLVMSWILNFVFNGFKKFKIFNCFYKFKFWMTKFKFLKTVKLKLKNFVKFVSISSILSEEYWTLNWIMFQMNPWIFNTTIVCLLPPYLYSSWQPWRRISTHLDFHSDFCISFIQFFFSQLRQWLYSQMALRTQQSRASQQTKMEQTFQTSDQNSVYPDSVTIMIKLKTYFPVFLFFLKHSLFNFNYDKLCYFS